MEEKKDLRQLIESLVEEKKKQEERKEKKASFRLPFKAKLGKVRVKKNYATFLVVKENRNVDFVKLPIDENTVMLDGAPRIVTGDEVLFYKGKPFVILPSWSTKPFSPTDSYEESTKLKYAAAGYRLLLNRMQSEVLKLKKSISGWLVFGIIALIAVGGYFAYQQGLFK